MPVNHVRTFALDDAGERSRCFRIRHRRRPRPGLFEQRRQPLSGAADAVHACSTVFGMRGQAVHSDCRDADLVTPVGEGVREVVDDHLEATEGRRIEVGDHEDPHDGDLRRARAEQRGNASRRRCAR